MECDPKGVNPRPDLCRQAGVKSFPTWVIDSQTREGVLTLDQLAEASKFRYEAKATNRFRPRPPDPCSLPGRSSAPSAQNAAWQCPATAGYGGHKPLKHMKSRN